MHILLEFWNATFVALLGLSAGVGFLALASPRAFETLASYGNRTLVQGRLTRLDKRLVDIDTFVFEHARLFGLVVVVLAGYLWWISCHGPEAYSRTSLLLIVTVALMQGIIALRHIMRQSREIELHKSEALVDVLTGLANRRSFDLELSRRLAQRQRQGTPLCLMIIDIDNFKLFNDKFGHLLGDAILKEVGNILSAKVRQMDFVARLGGDEFVVLLPGSRLEAASLGAERLRSAVSDSPLRYEGHEHSLTISIGLAEAQPDDDPSSLLKRSDSALYAA